MTNLQMRNGNCVAALAPSPGDLFVVTTMGGKVVFLQGADDYEKALRLAEAFADQMPPPDRPFTVKVLGMSLDELLAFKGISREEFVASISPEAHAEARQLAVAACKEALCDCNDSAVRRDAYHLLIGMGELAP
jgi:hypothetical protein